MICTNCKQPVQPEWNACPSCRTELKPDANPYAVPLHEQQPPNLPANGGDSTGGLIPYKNPKALIAYYLGIVSGIPFLGFPFGVAAFVLGILGLRDRKKNPVIKGSAHAWIGIGCGGVFALLWGIGGILLIIAAITQ